MSGCDVIPSKIINKQFKQLSSVGPVNATTLSDVEDTIDADG